MTISKNSKMMNLINYRLRITLSDTRVLTGQMLAFDKHMNLVLADCEEFRKMKTKAGTSQQEREQKRALGLVILRGETIVSLSVDGPPPPSADDQKARISQLSAGSGMMAPRGPAAAAAPISYGRGVPPPGAIPPPGMPAGFRPAPGMMPPGMPPGMPLPPGFRPMGQPGVAPPPGFRPRPGMPPGAPPPGFPQGFPPGPPPPGFQPPPGFRPPPPPGFRPPQ
ncbi:hypothetical protein BGX31_005441 [Mortierella sp. GBA43]|nr:hypothetical protein BGX31_005441 [Mortierella sp. GBA43]